ncbi:hypothetical protein [Enterovibrio coralii]|uniref:hypothetical protein n=1 Tax=Enterovibrio coralii TaxID=294935 RepID=UPI000AB74189|nr:hypothetical protein [Enterovibrio coralii]
MTTDPLQLAKRDITLARLYTSDWYTQALSAYSAAVARKLTLSLGMTGCLII